MNLKNTSLKLNLASFAACLSLLLPQSWATEASLEHQSQKAPTPIDKDIEVRNQMLTWSRQLGVTCNYCHDIKNFKHEGKIQFKIAREHLKMLKMLNDLYFSETDSAGKQKVEMSCYGCHKGQAKATWQEPPNNLTH